MRRLALILPAALALAACQPQVPDSARGVGFESYSDYMKRRDSELAAGGPFTPGPVISPERPSVPAPLPGGAAAAPAPVTAMPLPLPGAVAPAPAPADRPRADTIAGVAPQSGETKRAGISDEQDFSAVSARESIQSDAERRRRQAEQYVVVPPAPLPTRAGPSGPNIVQFALATSHAPGTKMYGRSAIRLRSYEAACGPFSSADLAQEEFLRRGGPERDPLGVDPDGDGFACGWDPRPFRLVKQ
jgi:hypothetical protein